MMTYELDDIDKEVLLGKVVERARADLNDGRPLTEMRRGNQMVTEKKTAQTGIAYRRQMDGSIHVLLDGKRVGVIRLYPKGWQYRPRSGKGGEFFATSAECKQSLESDQ